MSELPLKILRDHLKHTGYDGFFLSMADAFQTEFLDPSHQRIEYLTGFKGSYGSFLVLPDTAALFLDGRYTLQAQNQVDTKEIELHPYGFASIKTWLSQQKADTLKIAYDPWIQTVEEATHLETLGKSLGISFIPYLDENLVDQVWSSRPLPKEGPAEVYPASYTGEGISSKLKKITDLFSAHKIDFLFLGNPESICWLLNFRGTDCLYTPISYCYALVHKDASVDLFIDPSKISREVQSHFGPNVHIHPLNQIQAVLSSLQNKKSKVALDPKKTPSIIFKFLEQLNLPVLYLEDPCLLAKARKSPKEIDHIKQAHLWDGAALVKFMAYLEKEVPTGVVTEISAAAKLDEFRRESLHLKGLSFPTISAVGANSAMAHYRASSDHPYALTIGKMYLFDSGGQYFEGTTDVTRTISLGHNPSSKEKEIFTRVLKGHIALMQARFPKGTSGAQLDILARQYLWQIGQDYSHSTGHGVGLYLNVHEGPQNISPRSTVPLHPGMILSNEPGCYLENEFGVRIENLMFIKTLDEENSLLGFENLTWAPLDKSLLDQNLLSPEEIQWINIYHANVYKKLSPILGADLKTWLKNTTQKI
jgi:Xaa-Pro aminopeptidase